MSGCTVLILAGGTGGHVYPGLAVARVLRTQGVDLCWLGSRHGIETQVVPKHGIRLLRITVSGLRGGGLGRLLGAPLKLSIALCQSLWAMLRVRPRVVLGFGGFVSGPGGLAAWLCRKPLVIHEQNAIPGYTNQLLAKIATRVLETYQGSFQSAVGAITTGNPVRGNIGRSPHPRDRLQGRRGCRVLVLGGSHGAHRLNTVLPAALAASAIEGLVVKHQSGRDELQQTMTRYHEAGCDAEVSAFIEDMSVAYRWADFVVCRAGASTLAELALVGLGAILVPYPFAVDDHQYANARHFAAAGAAIVIKEKDLSARQLAPHLQDLGAAPERRLEMACKARTLAHPDAADVVAQHCLGLCNG